MPASIIERNDNVPCTVKVGSTGTVLTLSIRLPAKFTASHPPFPAA
jgi:hypothetical protein